MSGLFGFHWFEAGGKRCGNPRSMIEIVSPCSWPSSRSILLTAIIISMSSMLSLMALIMALRAKMTSLVVAALWSCAAAKRLAQARIAAPTIATAIERRWRDEFPLTAPSLHLHIGRVAGVADRPQHRGLALE